MSELLKMQGVCKTFAGDIDRVVLSCVDLEVSPGEFVVVTGPSGQGKSTLLSVAGGLLAPDAGTVELLGVDVASADEACMNGLRTTGVGYIFQRIRAFAALSVEENLVFAARRVLGRETDAAVKQALNDWGLVAQADQLPSQLSVGQQRRLAIARCLLLRPSLVLADEPTNDLDSAWCEKVVDRLAEHAEASGNAVVMVTHDERYARRATKRCSLHEGGVLVCEEL